MLHCITFQHLHQTRNANFPSALILLLVIWLLSSSIQIQAQTTQKTQKTSVTAKDEKEVRRLEQGKPVERELKGGEVHVYEVALTAGQFFKAVVEQKGIDVVVNMFAPDGKQVMKVNSPNGTQGPESVTVIGETTGPYRFEVHSLETKAPAGRYEARIEEIRTATAQDKSYISAERLFLEGEKLQVQGSADSLRQAIDKYQESVPLYRAAGNRAAEAGTLNVIGVIYYSLGERQKALAVFNDLLPLTHVLKDRAGEANTLNNIGLLLSSLGEKQKALDFFNKSLPLSREINNRAGEVDTLNNIGVLYDSLGEKQKAIDFYNQTLALLQALNDRAGEAVTLNNIGAVYYRSGENQKALSFFNKALPILQSVSDRYGEGYALSNIGMAHHYLGDNQKALDFLNQSLKIRRDIGDRNGEADTLNNIGAVYSSLKEHQKALDFFNQSLVISPAAGNASGEAGTFVGIALAERDRGNLNEARKQIEAALAIIESLRTKIASQELRSSYFATVNVYYDFYIDILMRLHKERPSENFNAVALKASERTRARSLIEILAEANADIRQGIDAQLLERERTFQRQLNAKAQEQMNLLGGKPTEEQVAAIKKEIDNLTTELQQTEAEIRQKSPRYAALTQPQPLSLVEIQTQVLDSDTVLLEYALGKDKSYLWAVTTDSITSYELPKRAEIEAAALSYYKLLTERNRRTASVAGETNAQKQDRTEKDDQRFAQADAQLPEAANKLSQMLLSPVAAQLGEKRLLIVADGALQYVPFAALPEPASKADANNAGTRKSTTQPLVVNHEIVSLPSASTLAVLRREVKGRASAPNMVAVLADPVFSKDEPHFDEAVGLRKSKDAGKSDKIVSATPSTSASVVRALQETGIARGGLSIPRLDATRREATSILNLVPKGATSVKRLDFDASRATVESGELAQYRIVHFATHGLLNSEHPELSGIVLSLVDERGEPQDGFIRLHEIYNLKLPAELVVLSACQTALGKEIKGEGLVGLTRGFMYAGAPRVVASLWQVDDAATRELMERFYRAMLTDKLRPAAALRRAQIEMSKQKQMGKPYNWAAFVLQGEWR